MNCNYSDNLQLVGKIEVIVTLKDTHVLEMIFTVIDHKSYLFLGLKGLM